MLSQRWRSRASSASKASCPSDSEAELVPRAERVIPMSGASYSRSLSLHSQNRINGHASANRRRISCQ
ncbi:MAG: hypothetical protein AAF544_13660, partial [Bacteroidota bacterium]